MCNCTECVRDSTSNLTRVQARVRETRTRRHPRSASSSTSATRTWRPGSWQTTHHRAPQPTLIGQDGIRSMWVSAFVVVLIGLTRTCRRPFVGCFLFSAGAGFSSRLRKVSNLKAGETGSETLCGASFRHFQQYAYTFDAGTRSWTASCPALNARNG